MLCVLCANALALTYVDGERADHILTSRLATDSSLTVELMLLEVSRRPTAVYSKHDPPGRRECDGKVIEHVLCRCVCKGRRRQADCVSVGMDGDGTRLLLQWRTAIL